MDDEGKSKEILMVDDGFFNLINSQNIFKNKKKPKKIVFSDNKIMEMIDISKIKEKNDSPKTKKLLKIYQEGIQNKSKCPPSLFNIIITIIILIVFIIIIRNTF